MIELVGLEVVLVILSMMSIRGPLNSNLFGADLEEQRKMIEKSDILLIMSVVVVYDDYIINLFSDGFY